MKAPDLLAWAIETCRDYRARGYSMALRQLYYRGVASNTFPSGDASYTRLMDIVSSARLEGKFPLTALVDRTRHPYPSASTRNDANVERALNERAPKILRELPEQLLHRDRWFGQPNHVSVWFEKEALSGVFDDICGRLGIGHFACRGDPSHPSLVEWLTHTALAHGVDNPSGWVDSRGNRHKGLAKKTTVLYFGDHDPTGIRIPRTAERTTRTFMGLMGLDFEVEFRRVGITLEQATSMDLPPFPAKVSAGKDYTDYVEEFGVTDAWELDALPPEELERLVTVEVTALFDKALHFKLQTDIDSRRDAMRAAMRDPAWLSRAFEEEE